MTTTIAIACHAGGVGKTTTTNHLAASLIDRGATCLAIDMDPQHSLTHIHTPKTAQASHKWLRTVSDVLTAGDLAGAIAEVTDGLLLVPSTLRLQETAAWMQLQTITHDHLSDALYGMIDLDAILIDCPPAADLLTINAICAADYVIVPVIPEPKGLDGLNRMRDLVAWLNSKRVSHAQILGMVITQMDARTKGHQQGVIDLQATGVPVLAEIPMAKGQDADAKLRHAYQPLVTAVLAQLSEDRHA